MFILVLDCMPTGQAKVKPLLQASSAVKIHTIGHWFLHMPVFLAHSVLALAAD